MTPVLYHYVHCPFCLRVRLALGYLSITYDSKVLAYDDEETPIALTGVKMLPIWQDENYVSNESIDILEKLDIEKRMQISEKRNSQEFFALEADIHSMGSIIHSMVMPYWVYTKEFDDSARKYFLKKKEAKRGPFSELAQKRYEFEEQLRPMLARLEDELSAGFYKSHEFGFYDILIASHLWGLYILPEFQFSEKIQAYLQEIKRTCHFEYHKDFWV